MSILPSNYFPLGSSISLDPFAPESTTHNDLFGFLSVNPLNGCIVLIFSRWVQGISTQYYFDIYFTQSIDVGATWSTEVAVSQELNIVNFAAYPLLLQKVYKYDRLN